MDPTRTPPSFVPPVNELADEAGPRAIEIAALLDDSIVGVRHLTDPRSGKVTRKTLALFAAGAVLLLIAFASFMHGVSVASRNARAQAAWIEAGHPVDEFRPARLSPAADAMAISGLVFGLAALYWALSRFGDERRPSTFRIGCARDVDFATAALPVSSFPLVSPGADGEFVFRRPPGASGERLLGGETTPLGELPEETPIPPGARFRVEAGPSTFLIASVPRPARTRSTGLAALEGTVLAVFAGSTVAHLAMVALLYSIPPDGKNLVGREVDEDGRLVEVKVKPTEPAIVTPIEATGSAETGAEGQGNAAKDPAGEMGKKDGPAEEKKFKLTKITETPQLASQEARERAESVGILGAWRRDRGGPFGTLINSADFSSGLDDATVYGGLMGKEYGESDGGWGLGVHGYGPGGDGTGLNSIGVGPGPGGTIGPGRGGKTGAGWCVGCSGSPHGAQRRAGGPPRVHIGEVTAPDVDKDMIRRYIRQKLAQFQHCYERRLIVKQELEGTVTLQFSIANTGQVTAASATGMDREVASCSADVVRSIQFPRMPSVVNVSRYPLTFHAAE